MNIYKESRMSLVVMCFWLVDAHRGRTDLLVTRPRTGYRLVQKAEVAGASKELLPGISSTRVLA